MVSLVFAFLLSVILILFLWLRSTQRNLREALKKLSKHQDQETRYWKRRISYKESLLREDCDLEKETLSFLRYDPFGRY